MYNNLPRIISQLLIEGKAALVTVLNLGYFFDLECTQYNACISLEQHSGFSVAMRFTLGIKNMLTNQIDAGFCKLIQHPLKSNVELLGL